MKTKEELINTYIKYSSDITEEIWDKLVIKFKELGFYLWQNKGYKRYKEGSIIFINEKGDNSYWVTDGYFTPNADKKEIQVLDILGEEPQFEVGKYYSYIWNWNNIGKCICKVSEVSKFQMRAEWDYMEVTKSFRMPGVGATTLHEISDIKELTQEEIQQYLPENHSDKLPKTIEKWSVGSYVVFLQRYGYSKKGTIDVIKEFNYNSSASYLEKEGVAPGYLDGELNNYLKWFATLPEAEVFSKSLLEPEESKTLSVDDLVEGEIYYCKGGMSHIFKYETGNDIVSESKFLKDNKLNINNCGGLRLATPEEKKWLLTCIKQDKFISPDQLDMYDSEGNLIEDKPKFKIGDWVVVIPSDNPFHNYKNAIGHIFPIRDDSAYYQSFIKGNPSAIDPNNTYGINYKLEDVRLATPEEIAKVTKPKTKPFKFNKWYKSNNADGLFFIQSENTGYGFRSNHKNYWFTRTPDMGNWNLTGLIPATIEEVKERLLSYAKEKYPIGTKFKCITYDKGFTVTNPNYMDNASGFNSNGDSTIWIGVKEQCSGRIFGDKGKWAEVISKPEPKESKEFDRNWYVEVSSQEEADKVFDWLRSQGEIANNNSPRRFGEYWNTIRYFRGIPSPEWDFGYVNSDILVKKQLSDILPNYSKVNRNVYYEVSNQEEYKEILDWLESNGEKVDRGFCVNNIWNFVYYHKDSKDWYLNNVKPDLPKAEFPFKSKQSIKVNTSFEEACPFPSFGDFSVDLSNITTSIFSEQVIYPTIEKTSTNEKVKVQLINVPRI